MTYVGVCVLNQLCRNPPSRACELQTVSMGVLGKEEAAGKLIVKWEAFVKTSGFTKVDASRGLNMLMSAKDSDGITNVRYASVLSERLLRKVLSREIKSAISKDQHPTHKDIAAKAEAAIGDKAKLEHLGFHLDPSLVDLCVTPTVQSGGNYSIRPTRIAKCVAQLCVRKTCGAAYTACACVVYTSATTDPSATTPCLLVWAVRSRLVGVRVWCLYIVISWPLTACLFVLDLRATRRVSGVRCCSTPLSSRRRTTTSSRRRTRFVTLGPVCTPCLASPSALHAAGRRCSAILCTQGSESATSSRRWSSTSRWVWGWVRAFRGSEFITLASCTETREHPRHCRRRVHEQVVLRPWRRTCLQGEQPCAEHQEPGDSEVRLPVVLACTNGKLSPMSTFHHTQGRHDLRRDCVTARRATHGPALIIQLGGVQAGEVRHPAGGHGCGQRQGF